MRSPRLSSVRAVAISNVALFGLAVAIVTAIGYLYAQHSLSTRLDARLEARMRTMADAARSDGIDGVLRVIDEYEARGARSFSYVLRDRHGRRLHGAADLPPLPAGWSDVPVWDADDDAREGIRAITRRLPDGSTLSILMDDDLASQLHNAFTFTIIAIILMTISLPLFGGATASRAVRRRLSALTEGAGVLMSGGADERLPLSPDNDEFDQLAMTLNRMLDRVDALMTENRRIVGYLAHDLRTPLARLRARIKSLGDGCRSAEVCRSDAAALVEDCDNVLRIFASILEIGSLKAGPTALVSLSWSALVRDLAETYQAVAEDAGRELLCTVEPGIAVLGNRELLGQALVNLIENAIIHTPFGSHIVVSLASHEMKACLTVQDDGPQRSLEEAIDGGGVPDTATSPPVKRESLGLHLVKAIASAHGGRFETLRTATHLTAQIELPCAGSGAESRGA